VTASRAGSSQALPDPTRVTVSFPSKKLPAGTELFRATKTDPATGDPRGFGFFSSGGAGRFDLAPPRGTCYLAHTAYAAAWESLGKTLSAAPNIDQDFTDNTWVWSVSSTADLKLADLHGSGANTAGVTGELDQGAFATYDIPQAWAALFDTLGFDGISYHARHASSAPDPTAVAAFDSELAHNGAFAANRKPVQLTTIAAALDIVVEPVASPPKTVPIS